MPRLGVGPWLPEWGAGLLGTRLGGGVEGSERLPTKGLLSVPRTTQLVPLQPPYLQFLPPGPLLSRALSGQLLLRTQLKCHLFQEVFPEPHPLALSSHPVCPHGLPCFHL